MIVSGCLIETQSLTLRGHQPHFELEETLGRTSGGPFHTWLARLQQKCKDAGCLHQLFKIRICVQSCGSWRHTVMPTVCNLFAFRVEYWHWSLCGQRQKGCWFDVLLTCCLHCTGRAASCFSGPTVWRRKSTNAGSTQAQNLHPKHVRLTVYPNTQIGGKSEERPLSLRMFYISF